MKQRFIIPKSIISLLLISIFAAGIYAADCVEIKADPWGNGTVCVYDDGTIAKGSFDITKVDASPNNPQPGELVKVEIEVKNNAAEDIENADISVNLDGLEDDNGNELEDDDSFNLRQGRTKTIRFEFNVPYDIEDKDTYSVNVDLEGEGKDSGAMYDAQDSSEEIRIDKKNHALRISRLDISPSTIVCNGNVYLDYEIMNIGSNDEDVTIEVTNDELGIDKKINEQIDEDDTFSDEMTLRPKLVQGIHDITFTAKYGTRQESKSVRLNIEECEEQTTDTVQKPKATLNTNVETEAPQEPEKTVVAIEAKPVQKSSSGFTNSDEYIMLLVILFVILLGAVIFAVGAAIILLSKKKL